MSKFAFMFGGRLGSSPERRSAERQVACQWVRGGRLALVLGGLLPVWAALPEARAAQPIPVPPGAENIGTNIPTGGYVATTRSNFRRLRLAVQSPQMGAPPAEEKKTRRLPVILVSFADQPDAPASHSPEAFQEMLFGSGPDPANPAELKPTLRQFYLDVSHGKLEIQGDVVGWYKLDARASHQDVVNYVEMAKGLVEALRKADNQLSFEKYDNDGPDGIPNTEDDDGKVDAVVFVHADFGAERTNNTKHIRSHAGQLGALEVGQVGPFETADAKRGADGEPVIDANGRERRIIVDDYIIQPAKRRDASGAVKMIEIGVFCHEYGHALGLPDLYDRTVGNAEGGLGVGCWCAMGYGMYGCNRANSSRPVHLSAWAKYYLRWANVQNISQSGVVPIEPVEATGKIFKIDVPGTNSFEYYLVELRDPKYKDPGKKVAWDSELPEAGLAIWHVDERVGSAEPNWPMTPLDKGQNDFPSLMGPQGMPAQHSLVALLQADQQQHIETRNSDMDAGDLWRPITGQAVEFNATGPKAAARGYDGKDSGIRISDIDLVSTTKTMRVTYPQSTPSLANGPTGSGAPAAQPPVAPPPAAAAPATAAPSSSPPPPAPPSSNSDWKEIRDKLGKGQAATLLNEKRNVLKKLKEETISSVSSAENQMELRTLAAEARTRVVSDTTSVLNSAETKLMESLRKAKEDVKVQVRSDPTGRYVQKLSALNLKATSKQLAADARTKLDEYFLPLFEGINLELNRDLTFQNQVTFQQMVQVAGEWLPLFGSTVRLQYDPTGTTLKLLTSDIIPPDTLRIEPAFQRCSAEAAAQHVSDALGTTVRVEEVKLGVWVQDRKKEQRVGIVCWRVPVANGDYNSPTIIMVEASSGKAVSLK